MRRSLGVGLAGLAAAVALTACGGSGGSGGSGSSGGSGGAGGSGGSGTHPADPTAAVRGAYDATARAGTARIAVQLALHANGRVTTSVGTSLVDFTHAVSSTTLAYTDGTKAETRSFGDTVYLPVDPTSQRALGEKPWIRTTEERESGGISAAFNRGITGPADVLGFLRVPPRSVTEVGTDTAGGVAATRYHVVVDLTSALAGQPAAGLARFHADWHSPVITEDVWLDGHGRIVKVVLPYVAGDVEAATAELSEFGTPVHVTAPPANQVGDDSMLPR